MLKDADEEDEVDGDLDGDDVEVTVGALSPKAYTLPSPQPKTMDPPCVMAGEVLMALPNAKLHSRAPVEFNAYTVPSSDPK